MKLRDWNIAEVKWVKLMSHIGSKSAVWENFGMLVYKSIGVRRQYKEHVICKLCDATLKYFFVVFFE